MKGLTIGLLLIMASTLSFTESPDIKAPQPPVAERVDKVIEIHGDRLVDPYFWMRQKSDPKVRAYLEAENAYADALMKPTGDLQEKLYQEMVGHIKETDEQPPYPQDGYFYYSRTEKGKQYPILCRKKVSVDAPERIILDVNKLAESEKFMAIGASAISDDGNLLAYSTDNTGFRQYTLHVKDLRTGQVLPDMREKIGSIAWAADNKTLFYTIEDHAKRQYRVYRHTLGQAQDDLIYEEKDERFSVEVDRTRSKAFVLMAVGSLTQTEYRYLPADQPSGEWKMIQAREPDIEYQVDHHGDEFLILVNDKGRNFRLVSAPVSSPGKQNWKELIPHRPDVMLTSIDSFADFYAVSEREKGLPHIRIAAYGNGKWHRIEFDEPVYALSPSQNREYKTSKFRYNYQSLVTPASVYDYDVNTRAAELKKRTEVPGYDPAQYTSERLWANAPDGTKVPVSLVYRKGLKRDGSSPMLLMGYGSYGYSYPVAFSSNLLSLLDRGFVYGIAHIRGGSEMGKPWHDAGRMMNKKNTFTDFIAAAEKVLAEKYTSPDRLAIQGGSAGGLLMGAVVNLRPDLFRAVITKVPFVDVISSMLDETLPLTVGEFEEWGNPKKKDEYLYMKSYSPYDNLRAATYPAMLVKTSFNDSQVMYWEPAKYVAKLRTLKKGDNPLLLKTNMNAGHGSASGRYDYLREIAFDYAFLLQQVGTEKQPATDSR